MSAYVREDEKEFIRIVRDAASAGQEQTAREQKKRLRQVEKRIAELDELIKKLYEGNATGKIPDKHFNRLLVEYDTEQNALEQEAAELKEGITAQAEDGMRAQRFVSLVRRYTNFDELTAPMLNEFIEKVVVHEADKSTGDRRQKVDIYFNFIGCFVPPKPEVILTAVEEAKEDFNKLSDSVNNAKGAAERMAAIKLDNLEGDLPTLAKPSREFSAKETFPARGILSTVFLGNKALPSLIRSFPFCRRWAACLENL